MLAPVSERKESKPAAKSVAGLRASMRDEFALTIGLGTAAIFYATGNRFVENITHPIGLIVVFLWLFIVILWAALSVVRHADCLAVKCGEPYGTLILTLAAIGIEVAMISTAMLHGANNPTLARGSGSADRKSTRLNSSHLGISYAVFCLKKKMARLP